MRKKIDTQKIINRSWFYTKILFGLIVICAIAFGYGTFKPNQVAIKNVTQQTPLLDKEYY